MFSPGLAFFAAWLKAISHAHGWYLGFPFQIPKDVELCSHMQVQEGFAALLEVQVAVNWATPAAPLFFDFFPPFSSLSEQRKTALPLNPECGKS